MCWPDNDLIRSKHVAMLKNIKFYSRSTTFFIEPFKDEAQTAVFKDQVRTAQ